MADPFQDVDAAGPDFIKVFADAMDTRQADPTMEAIVAAYLSGIAVADDAQVIEIGAGAGAVSRRIAAKLHPVSVTGFDPSAGFVAEASLRGQDHPNLTFQTADGADLPLDSGIVDAAIMHTVLTHVTAPQTLIAEAARVLKPGGTLIVCDCDFSKATFGNVPNDPLDICARAFVRGFVTDPFLVGKLRQLVMSAGLEITDFTVQSRVITTPASMVPWVEMTTKAMVDRGEIGQPLAQALRDELDRRADNGTLYGYQAFATLIATKPA